MRIHAFLPPAEGPPGPAFPVDPEETEEARIRRRYDFAAKQVPLARALGYLLIALCVAAQNRWVEGSGSPGQTLLFAALAGAYSLVSWLSLRWAYGRTGAFDLQSFWMYGDFAVRILALYCSGGPRSLLFPVLLTGIFDNVLVSFRQTLVSSLGTLVLYLGMLAWVWGVDGQAVQAGVEGVKLAILAGSGLYLLSGARVAEQLRDQRRKAVALSRDLIQRTREQAEALDRARLLAEQHSRAKSQFLAGMSHELRTPLNTILLYSELLEAEAQDNAETPLAEDAHRIRHAGKHLLELVNDLLDLSRIEAGRMELDLQPCSLRAIAQEAAAAVEGPVARGHNRLSVEIQEAELVDADALRVRQILINLLGNAAKFTEGGTIILRGWVGPDSWGYEVQDTGIGMSPEQVDRIFRDFAQAEADTARKYGGTGLGLSLSQKLCDLMGGTITVSSEPGKGSTFRMEVPRAQP